MSQHDSGLASAAAQPKPGNLVCLATDLSPINQNATRKQAHSVTDRVRLRFLARRLHRLGEAPVFYFLEEIERGAPLRQTLEIYAEIDADFVKAFGGDKFAAPFVIDNPQPQISEAASFAKTAAPCVGGTAGNGHMAELKPSNLGR